jgi:ParB family chromosome partitioning protein
MKFHPAAEIFPMLPAEELAALASDIAVNGLLLPITLDDDGAVVDGRNRLAACKMAEVQPRFETLKPGVDPRGYVASRNIQHRHLSKGRQAMAMAMLFPEPAKLKRAGSCKIQEQFVDAGALSRARKVLAEDPELARLVMAGDKPLADAYATVRFLEAKQADPLMLPTGGPAVDALAESRSLIGDIARTSDEWYTPSSIVKSGRQALGGRIDLDPCSCPAAQETVRADRYFSKGDDGLAQRWAGRVWCNPPFSLVSRFVEKVVHEYEAGGVTTAILLTNDCTDTAWFHRAARAAAAICFPRGRIKFISPVRDTSSPMQGAALFYFGAGRDAFEAAFAGLGVILRVAD